MWVFLVTEILFFGALFAMYAILRFREPEVFAYSALYLDTIMGGVNTIVLILSSLTMAMAVHFAQRSMKGPLVLCLILTLVGAGGFLVIKWFEYTHKIHAHLVWGPGFYKPVRDEEGNLVGVPQVQDPAAAAVAAAPAASGPAVVMHPILGKPVPAEASVIKPASEGPKGIAIAEEAGEESAAAETAAGHGGKSKKDQLHLWDPELPVGTHQFFAIYYCMTGLHGIHVVVGMGLIGWLTLRAMRGEFDGNYYTPVDLVGLYWHIVDLIWIFLFPLFYLIH